MTTKTVFIAAGTTSYALPSDWGPPYSIECIGRGGNGGTSTTTVTGAGGGGGAYAKITDADQTYTFPATITVQVGDTTHAITTFWQTTHCIADYGRDASGVTRGVGGLVANSTGHAGNVFAGGAAGTSANGNATGGGGAGGPHGLGTVSGNGTATTGSRGGTGGGGADGGGVSTGVASNSTGSAGGTNRSAGAGGAAGTSGVAGGVGTTGSGGGGGSNVSTPGFNGGNGSFETLWTQTSDSATAGPGSGGGGGDGSGTGGAGGGYGGGGGGHGLTTAAAGGVGAPGIIVVIYTVTATTVVFTPPPLEIPIQRRIPQQPLALVWNTLTPASAPPVVVGAAASPAGVIQSSALGFQYQAHTEPVSILPETTTVDRWFVQLSLPPVLGRQLTRAAAAPALIWSGFTPAAAVTTTIEWFQPFVIPVRRVAPLYLPPPTGPPNTSPETTTVDRWHQPLSVPSVLRRSMPAAQQAAHTEPVSISPETTTVDRWLLPFSLPVWAKPGLRAAAQQAHAAPILPQPDAALVQVYPPLATPILPVNLAARQQTHIEPVSISPETTTVDRWHQPLSLPSVLRRTMPAAHQQAHTEPVSTSPETTTVDRWFLPFSLPVWAKPGLTAAAQQAFTAQILPQPAAALIQVYPPLATPILPISLAARQQAHTEPVSTAPETTTVDRWHQPLSVPLRAAQPRQQPAALIWSGFTPVAGPVVVVGAAASPVGVGQSSALGFQYQAHTEPVSTAPETTTVDRWFQSLSVPLRAARPRQQPAALVWSGSTPTAAAVVVGAATLPVGVSQPSRLSFQYQAQAKPVFVPPVVPVVGAATLPVGVSQPSRLGFQYQAHTEPVFVPVTPRPASVSPAGVGQSSTLSFQYQAHTEPVFVPAGAGPATPQPAIVIIMA